MDIQFAGGIFGAIHLVLFLIALFEIISSDRPLVSKVLWGALVLILPCAGLIIYFFFGRKS